MAPKPLLITCEMPLPPPMNRMAATILVAKKAIATGRPSIISVTPRPNRITAAQYHSTALAPVFRLPAERPEEVLAAPQEAAELDRHHAEGDRDEDHDQPARHVHRAHVDVLERVVANRDLEAVPGKHRADGDAGDADQHTEA